MAKIARFGLFWLVLSCLVGFPGRAQQTLGSINGTIKDASGAVVQGAKVTVRNTGTNLEVTSTSNNDGSFSFVDLPLGTYAVTFTADGFKKEVYSQILVQGNRTTSVNATLQPGEVTATVTVSGTPLLNETDTTMGYTLGSELVESIPLGTGSFTQLAILSPGVNADFLSGSGTNEGLGNQAIWANGQRDTSNSFSFNSVVANNLFNGKSTSYVSTSRFILNTGENFGAGGQVQTNTSVYDAIGQGLPTPPVETIQELHVNTSMYDATQGANSGAHIAVTTKSGTNDFHGQAYEYHQTSGWDATPFFLKASGFTTKDPPLHRNTFGGMLGGPVIKDKLFFFGSYQGQRITDALNGSLGGVPVPTNLTDQRDAATLESQFGVSSVDPVALAILNAKTPTGQFIVPSFNPKVVEGPNTPFDSIVQGPPSKFNADQVNGNLDYAFGSKDRLSGKYYYQHDPSSSPFAVSQVLGFNQSLDAGSHVFSLDNTTALTSKTTWEQRLGFIRQLSNATTGQTLTPSGVGLNLLGSKFFPGFTISNADGQFHDLRIGPATNFANAGVFQNQFEGASNYTWIVGRHSLSFGFNYDYGQLNVINRENQVATFNFHTFNDFLTGNLAGRSSGRFLDGETNRYFRSKQAGLYAQDNIKLKSNLNVILGLRWDWDGPLYEKNGLLTNFYPQDYSYTLATDTINSTGLVVAGNNKAFGTKGVSDSTLTGRQWIFEPRIGVAWSPSFIKNFVIRSGFGMYADRGEFFTEFGASAGLGISGPFGVTTEEPFTIPFNSTCTGPGCLSNNPFGTAPPPPPPSSLAGVNALIHNQSQLSGCTVATPTCTPTSNPQFAFLFGGYDPRNTLPYSENWSLDLQWQPYNTLVLTMGYVGNHGLHEVMPIPFNQPGIATPQNPINGQTATYGYQAVDSNPATCPTAGAPNFAPCPLQTEQVQTTIGDFTGVDGNTALRVPFIGYNPNSDFWEAEGISNYNALLLGVNKRLSHGLQVNASYTWSHALDEQSALGLFYNGNNPLNPRSGYGSADFDRTHVFTISYLYQFPKLSHASRLTDVLANGWAVSGITVAESGQPFVIYDFSGTVGGIYFSADDFITNPILPLASGVTPSQAQAQGTTGVNAAQPYINVDGTHFSIPLLAPGQSGVPACGTTVNPNTGAPTGTVICDNFETGFGNTGRNTFRAPFQTRFDFSVAKDFKISERLKLKYEADLFNLFNHASFDAPNNNPTLNGCFNPQPCYSFTSPSPASQGVGFIQNTLGSPRFIQMSLHLTF